MIKVLRKHRNWLMIVIAILALPFCLYFVKSDTSLIRSDEFARLYGRKVTVAEARWDARLVAFAGWNWKRAITWWASKLSANRV